MTALCVLFLSRFFCFLQEKRQVSQVLRFIIIEGGKEWNRRFT